MNPLQFTGSQGDFILKHAQRHPEIYFPLVNESQMISSITPLLAGDCKADQNTFLLAPASSETLHESRATRNFWVCMDGYSPWSAAGQSAPQMAARFTGEEEEVTLSAGLLWHKVSRIHKPSGLTAEILSFVPADAHRSEIMQVTLTNGGTAPLRFTPIAAIPLYGRSADNIRDHRHVTSLLHRVTTVRHGIDLHPTLTFDERGHQKGSVTYRVWGAEDAGTAPVGFVPLVRDYVGSGSYDWPEAVVRCKDAALLTAGQTAEDGEVVGALYFAQRVLAPGEACRYQIVMTINDDPTPYLTAGAVETALAKTKAHWQQVGNLTLSTANSEFDAWIRWVGIQPTLRRICGCSFLPHHDYGRGGRGWRDLWQDSLALLLRDPKAVRQDLLCYFAGIRTDGTNATIIGAKPGEFKADRNNIPRVWMDHGFWPLLTTELYLNETGDNGFLLEKQSYFRDTLAHRGQGAPLHAPGVPRDGTVLEHLLIQCVTAFFDVGENGSMRLRGADWNDGLDMARSRGESVAFTAAYAGNFETLAHRLSQLDVRDVEIAAPLAKLMRVCADSPKEKNRQLYAYCAEMEETVGTVQISVSSLQERLLSMARQLKEHIRRREWVSDGSGHNWFNSYYDDHARPVEGVESGDVRMMLTGQVFTLLSGTATDEQARKIIAAARRYLCDARRGGYCLNTNFREVKLDMGRMFGFAYGTKENGAVFCHMAVMYAYALFSRGFAAEGWEVLQLLYDQCADFEKSRILPGIPEYFDERGQGMYPYLTGSGSWLLLTIQTQLFGVRGKNGALEIAPKLLPCHFDDNATAAITCTAVGREMTLRFHNPQKRTDYHITSISCGGISIDCHSTSVVLPAGSLPDGSITMDIQLG